MKYRHCVCSPQSNASASTIFAMKNGSNDFFKVNGADLVVQLNGGSIAFLRFSLNSLCNV